MLNKAGKLIKYIRELVWPILEPLEKTEPIKISELDCMWANEEVDLILQYIEKYKENEDKRKSEVESKSTIFIGTFGVAITVLINLIINMILTNQTHTILKLFIICIMTFAIIYLCRAIWFSIKALERKNYFTLGFPNSLLSDAGDKKREIIICQYNNISKNRDLINLKVDYMNMAHEYFKRTIMVVTIFSSLLLFYYIYAYKNITKEIYNLLCKIDVNQTIILGIAITIIALVLIIVYLLYKIKRLSKPLPKND